MRDGDDDIINIDLEDLEETPSAPVAGGMYPAIEAGVSREEALGIAPPGIEVTCVCSGTRRPFAVHFREAGKGRFEADRTIEQTGKALAPPDGGKQAMTAGHFGLAAYQGCPYCGSTGLVACDDCGVVMCGGGIKKGLLGGTSIVCPACGSRGTVAGEARSVRGGGTGGKKGKGV
jgi:hypothetical protein